MGADAFRALCPRRLHLPRPASRLRRREAEANGAAVVRQGVMPRGMKFAYVSADATGVPYLEIALIPAEIRAFFDYVKREAT